MNKVFTYSIQCGPSYYSEQTDEDFFAEREFEYEVGSQDLEEALAQFIYEDYFTKATISKEQKPFLVDCIKKFISDQECVEALADYYEDNLKDYFESEAFDSLND